MTNVFGFKDGYEFIESLKEDGIIEGREDVDKLYAIGRETDPFVVGTPAHYKRAQYFADVYIAFKKQLEDAGRKTDDINTRRMHYWMLGRFKKYDSDEDYINTKENLSDLEVCARYARILGHIPPSALVDRHNPPAGGGVDDEALCYDTYENNSRSDDLTHTVKIVTPDVLLRQLSLTYRGIRNAAQPYDLEVWCDLCRHAGRCEYNEHLQGS